LIESAADALADPIFVTGVIAGVIVLALGIALSAVRGRDEVQRYGGVMVAAATLLVLLQFEMIGLSQLFGVVVLAIAGLFRATIAVGAAIAIPGAFLVARPDSFDPHSWLPWFAMFCIVLAAPLVASFDDHYRDTGLPLPLFGIAALGLFLTVPDTEGAMALLGVAGVAGFLGWPRPVATLGAGGSFAAVGVYVLVALEGAIGRPASIIAAMAIMGLLFIVPITDRMWGAPGAAQFDRVDPLIPLIAQLVLVLVISRTAGRIAGVLAAAAVTLALLIAAAFLTRLLRRRRPTQMPD